MTLVITTCTNSKRGHVSDALRMRSLPAGRSAEVGAEWGRRLRQADRVPVRDLYLGRGFQAAAKAATDLDARLLVVSAGLGLVDSTTPAPPYACTVLTGVTDSVGARVSDAMSSPEWWRMLQETSPFAEQLEQVVAGDSGPILAALSDAYLAMVADDLIALEPEKLAQLRLFTRAPMAHIPVALRPFVMPYDDRLEGPDSGCAGPRSNFASRALAHFAQAILAQNDDRTAAQHQCAVVAQLAGWRWPEKVERRRLSDVEIMELIEQHWDTAGGSTGRLLSILRHDLKVSCEQKRCKILAQLVRDSR